MYLLPKVSQFAPLMTIFVPLKLVQDTKIPTLVEIGALSLANNCVLVQQIFDSNIETIRKVASTYHRLYIIIDEIYMPTVDTQGFIVDYLEKFRGFRMVKEILSRRLLESGESMNCSQASWLQLRVSSFSFGSSVGFV